MGSKSPQQVDSVGYAREQAAANADLTAQQNWANRPTQVTPWGKTTWETTTGFDPGTGKDVTKWTQNQELSDPAQKALNEQLKIQEDRSKLAGTFMGRVASDYNDPFDWSDINRQTPMMGAPIPANYYTQATGAQTEVPQQQLDTSAIQRQQFDTSAPQQRALNTYLQGQQYDTSSPQQLTSGQQSLSPTTQTANAANFSADRQRIENELFQRMQPEHDRQTAMLQTQLANQGLTPGSDAYNQQLQTLSDNQARERFNAVQQGGQEQANLQNMLMGQQQQAFGQQSTAGQFGLGAQQQAFGQDMSAQQAQNAAKQAQFQQALSSGQFSNEALQQMFGQDVAAQQAQNAGATSAYGQDIAAQQARNAALQAQYQQALSSGQFNNQALQQLFGQNAAASNQNYTQQMNSSQMANQLRQQAISENMQRRNMSLNEMNAMLTGQQVSAPSMPGFNSNQRSQAADLLGASTQQYAQNLDSYNAQQQQMQGLMSGAMGLGSSAAMM